MYTTGAIIVTNDGELSNKLTHPKNNIEKEYYITIKGKITEEEILRLETGIEISTEKYISNEKNNNKLNKDNKYITNTAKVKVLGYNVEKNEQRISLIIHEGKNRQVRKMFKALGCSVIALHRNRFRKA